ncbi:MAG: nucleotidyltransferase domain-containing protein [bacterium]
MNVTITKSTDEITDFCRANGIRWLAVFGSAVSGDMRPGSDVDVLVELAVPVGLFRLCRMEREMSKLFGGRKVDLVVKQGLDKIIRDEVLANCEVLYGKAG